METWIEDLWKELRPIADESPIVYAVLASVRGESQGGRLVSEREALLLMVRELHKWGMTVERCAREAMEKAPPPIIIITPEKTE